MQSVGGQLMADAVLHLGVTTNYGKSYQLLSRHSPADQLMQHHHSVPQFPVTRHLVRHQHGADQTAAAADELLGAITRLDDNLDTLPLLNLTTTASTALPSAYLMDTSDQSTVTSAVYPTLSAMMIMNDDEMNSNTADTVSPSGWVGNISQYLETSTEATMALTEPSMRSYETYEELELLSGHWQIALIILYSLTAALALIGNIIAFWVLMWGKRSSKGTLRIFLVNLSLSDITMATFSIPFTYTDFMLGRWIWPAFFCPVVQCMQMTSVFVSVYTLTAVGIDRYVAIMYPLWSGHFSRIFMPIALPLIWLLGFTLGSVQFLKTQALPFLIAGDINYDCKERWSPEQSQFFTSFVFFVTFLFPMVVLSFTYGSIAVKMCRRAAPGNADVARDRIQQASKLKTLKMLATTVICFAFCWAPLHTLNLFIYFGRDFMSSIYDSAIGFRIYVSVAFISHWLSMANSFLNPFVYSMMSENFRSDLRLLLRKLARRLPCLASKSLLNSSSSRQQTFSTRANSRNSFYPNNNSNNQSIRNGSSTNKGAPQSACGQKITALMTAVSRGAGGSSYRPPPRTRQDEAARGVVVQFRAGEQCEILAAGTGTEASDPLVSVVGVAAGPIEEGANGAPWGDSGPASEASKDAPDDDGEEAICKVAPTATTSSTSTRPLAALNNCDGQRQTSQIGGSGPLAFSLAPELEEEAAAVAAAAATANSNGRLGANSRLASVHYPSRTSPSPGDCLISDNDDQTAIGLCHLENGGISQESSPLCPLVTPVASVLTLTSP